MTKQDVRLIVFARQLKGDATIDVVEFDVFEPAKESQRFNPRLTVEFLTGLLPDKRVTIGIFSLMNRSGMEARLHEFFR